MDVPGLLHLLLHARRSSGTGRKKTASDRSILYLYLAELEIEKWHESSIWSRLETFVQKKLNNNELVAISNLQISLIFPRIIF